MFVKILKKFMGKVLLLLVSIIISLGLFFILGEIYISIEKNSRGKPNPYLSLPYYASGKTGDFIENGEKVHYTFGYRVNNNKYGFREKDFETPKPNGVYRIMVLGDSFTWGAGMPVEKRYSNILEKLLNEEVAKQNLEKRMEVLTFSRGGGYMGKLREYLEENHNYAEPDLVVVGMCYNDPNSRGFAEEGTRGRYEDEIIPKYTRFLKKVNYFYSNFLKSKLTSKGIFNLLERINVIPDPIEANWITGYDKNGKNWKNFINDLKFIKELSLDITGVPPIIIFLLPPGRTTRPSYYKKPGRQEALAIKMFEQVKPEAKRIGFITVDVLPAFKGELDGKYLALNTTDNHPNELCHKVYAKELKKAVLKIIVAGVKNYR